MKILKSLFTLIMTSLVLSVFSQTGEIPNKEASLDFSVGSGKDLFSGAISWNRLHGVFGGNKFRLGYGLRASILNGKNLVYSTAPAKLASDNSKVDTLSIESANTIGVNAVINIQYKLSRKLALGFNIDALGIGLGSKINGKFISSENENVQNIEASPTSFNVLLVGNNDIGQLKSELYAEYLASSRLGIRAGLDLTFSEYTTTQKLKQDNDRFRNKANLIFLGISYKL